MTLDKLITGNRGTFPFLFQYRDQLSKYLDEEFKDIDKQALYSAFDEDIILTSKEAMEFLIENDVTLTKSMKLADTYNYQLSVINSEKLANILLRENVNDELAELEVVGEK